MNDSVSTKASLSHSALSINAHTDRFAIWITRNVNWLAIAIIVAAFVVRVIFAASCYLNPDESILFSAARPTSWSGAYRASFSFTHPPLFILVLHAFLFIGRTELILRLPSLSAGTAALWFTFAWMRRSIGEIPALAGLLFLSVSPAAISAATEVRQYGLLLFFICGALYAMDRALTERSTRWVILHGLLLICAVLTHYTAVITIFSLELYIVARCFLDRVPRHLVFRFIVCQIVLGATLVWLYLGQIRNSMVFNNTTLSYLDRYYFAKGSETWFGYLQRAWIGTFAHMIGPKVALPLMIVLVAGSVALLVGRTHATRSSALLVLSPFAFGFIASLYRVFPFAGSRHQTYLLPFAAAGVAAALAWLPSTLAAPSLLLGAAVSAFWIAHVTPDNNPRKQPISDMSAAVDYIRSAIPASAPLFLDQETRLVLEYYLGRNDPSIDSMFIRPNPEEKLEGHRIVSPPSYGWSFDPADALVQVRRSAKELGVAAPGQPLWIVSVAWFDSPLPSRLPPTPGLDAKDFGFTSAIEIPQ